MSANDDDVRAIELAGADAAATPIVFEVSQDGMAVTRLGTGAAADTESGTNVRVTQVQSPTFEASYVTTSKDGSASHAAR